MKTSELISNLETMLREHGDLPVMIQDVDNELGTPVAGAVMELECGHIMLILVTALQSKLLEEQDKKFKEH